jgi:UDP-N-acetylmuramyl pentapeptide phosphotransferase/UDP-N-acetylglucosamine-1-phosphate transferase
MNPFYLFFAFLTSLLITIVLTNLFVKYNLFDAINHRSVHKSKATKIGGISIFLTLFVFSVVFYVKGDEIYDFSLLIPLGIMFIVGVYDDFYNADFKLKFLLQIIVAKILIDQGLVINNFHGIFGLYSIGNVPSQLFTIFVFLVIVNAINFIDGIDGLAISETAKVILIIELFSVSPSQIQGLGQIILVSLLPLYYFNFKKEKKVFLGDSGSLLLGTLISIYTIILLGDNYQLSDTFSSNKAVLSMIILIYPLVDLLRVFAIRVANKKSPFRPDNNHIHHYLLKKGINHLGICFLISIISISLLLMFALI